VLLKTTGGKERMAVHQSGLPATARRLDPDDIARLHADKTAIYTGMLANGELALRPGIADLITDARAAGMAIAVATTTNLPNVEALCQCCWGQPATRVFDVIAAGDQVAAKKPAPDVFALALNRLGLAAPDCLAFEDSRNGILSAKGAGLRVLVTPSAYTNEDDLGDADWIFDTVALARAMPGNPIGLG
jgi:HAD superfamily hydrolase (TIGR01509 family)